MKMTDLKMICKMCSVDITSLARIGSKLGGSFRLIQFCLKCAKKEINTITSKYYLGPSKKDFCREIEGYAHPHLKRYCKKGIHAAIRETRGFKILNDWFHMLPYSNIRSSIIGKRYWEKYLLHSKKKKD